MVAALIMIMVVMSALFLALEIGLKKHHSRESADNFDLGRSRAQFGGRKLRLGQAQRGTTGELSLRFRRPSFVQICTKFDDYIVATIFSYYFRFDIVICMMF